MSSPAIRGPSVRRPYCYVPTGLAWRQNLDGLLDHVQSRFFGIGFADRCTVGLEFEELVLLGIVNGPFRQSRNIRITGLGEVCPVGVHHPGDLLVFRYYSGSIAGTKVVEYIRDFGRVRRTITHHPLH